jgi:hypothetical protein
MRMPKVTKSKAIAEVQGVVSSEQYETGDLVSADQYVVRTPGRLIEGYGKEAEHNMYHGGTIFRDAASNTTIEFWYSISTPSAASSKSGYHHK